MNILGSGCFREAYEVGLSKVVLKFPQSLDDTFHSRLEMKRIAQLKQHKSIRPHLPKIYHYEPSTGVILMKKYKPIENEHSSAMWAMWRMIKRLIEGVSGRRLNDLGGNNCALDKGEIILLDLGY